MPYTHSESFLERTNRLEFFINADQKNHRDTHAIFVSSAELRSGTSISGFATGFECWKKSLRAMASRRSKKVSFNKSSKIVEIIDDSESNGLEGMLKEQTVETANLGDDEFDPDTMDIDLTTGKQKKGVKSKKEDFTIDTIPTSLLVIPYHLPLLLFTMIADGQLLSQTKEGLQKGFYNLSILSLIYSVLVGEVIKNFKNPKSKSTGPTGAEFLYTAVTYPISVFLAIPLYGSFLLFGAPTGPLTILTFYLASHVSLIVFYPLLNVYRFTDKNAKTIWWKLFTFQVSNWKLNQVYCSTLGGLLGCWLGVFPIPLDWDRDWQDWPITLLVGAYSGAFLGSLLSYLYGHYIILRSTKKV